jgi:hypothetical protein
MDQGRIVLEVYADDVFAHRQDLHALGLGLPLVLDLLAAFDAKNISSPTIRIRVRQRWDH